MLLPAFAAIPVLPPDPLQVVQLEQEQPEGVRQDLAAAHPSNVAPGEAMLNRPSGPTFGRSGPSGVPLTPVRSFRGYRSNNEEVDKVIGLALALVVVGLVLLFVLPWAGGAIGAVGLVLLLTFLLGFGRRAATRSGP